jgi:hypothetical protein
MNYSSILRFYGINQKTKEEFEEEEEEELRLETQ